MKIETLTQFYGFFLYEKKVVLYYVDQFLGVRQFTIKQPKLIEDNGEWVIKGDKLITPASLDRFYTTRREAKFAFQQRCYAEKRR